jgi:ABC-type Na+ efflux pump permease subunit
VAVGLYIAVAVICTAWAAFGWYRGGPGSRELPITVATIQAVVGLLLLSVSASTSLAEERVRGSLDVLLATPLSTSSIVWGKWWGAYRGVPLVALLPTLLAVVTATENGRFVGPILVLALILAYGAAITSLGLALATRFARLATAVALNVVAYVGMTIGWLAFVMFVLIMVFGVHNRTAEQFALVAVVGSPPYGIGLLCAAITEQGRGELWPACAVAAVFWIHVYAAIAGGLLWATLGSFDRRMGRMPEGPDRPRLIPRRESVKPELVGAVAED